MRERERGRLGGGEEWGISKQEVTELRGTGGQFSSTQRGQSRGHWPFPPFLSLCPPPHHSIMLTLFVFHFAADLKLPLSSSGHISSRAPPCFFPTCVPSFLHSDLLVYFSPTLSSSSFPFFFWFSPTWPAYLSLLRCFPLLIFHFLCPIFPAWAHWIVMWGAVALLTKHKALHIHPAPGIFGYCSVVGVSMWERQWEADKQGKKQNEGKKCRMPFIHQNWSQVANLMFLNFLWLYKKERNYIILEL